MQFNRYEIFLKVVELGNITKAAEALHYTQAGVSHAVAALEREAGVPLLVRGPGGVALTENGQRLLAPVRSLVNEQRGLAQAIHELGGTLAGTLRVATFTSVSVRWLPRVIRAFQARYPQVEFDLLTGDYDEITEQVLGGVCDCGFLSAPAHAGLEFTPLASDPMLVLLPRGHALAARPALTLAEVKGEPLILPAKGSDNDIRRVLACSRQKARVRYTLNDDFSVMAMVANGFGVTVMPELIVQAGRFELETRPLDPPQVRQIGIASLPRERVSVLTRAFVEFLAEGARAAKVS